MDDSSLRTLKVSRKDTKEAIELQPPFQKNIKSYTCSVASDVDSLIFTAAPTEGDAFCQVQKMGSDGAVPIREGDTLVDIKVDAVDGSSSVYTIQVYRPSGSDATLRGFDLSDGVLRPDFHKLETRYMLLVGGAVNKVTIKALPLNPKSTIQPSASGDAIALNPGDTTTSFHVKSADGSKEETYHITIRRDKLGSFPIPLSNNIPQNLICSLCSSLIFRPRFYVRPSPSTCTHTYCSTCLELYKAQRTSASKAPQLNRSSTENLVADLKANESSTQCPLCPDSGHGTPSWTNNPLVEPDGEAERVLAAVEVGCPFEKTGCNITKIPYGDLVNHVTTSHSPMGGCEECGAAFIDAKELTDGKHKSSCTTTCPDCGKKVPLLDKDIHPRFCISKLPPLPTPTIDTTTSPTWEQQLIDKKTSPTSVPECIAASEKAITSYLSTLHPALLSATTSFGSPSTLPQISHLQTASHHLATAIQFHREKGSTQNDDLHLRLGMVLEEALMCSALFPAPVQTGRSKASDNDEAAESFMADEVEGLLESLGVAGGASDAAKVRAIEGEYQRLKGLGLSDQAAEVRGLYAWKIKQMAGSGGDALGEAASKARGIEIEHVIEKYKTAVAINPDNAEAKILLLAGKVSESSMYLQRALALKPFLGLARALRGACILQLSTPLPSIDLIQIALHLLKDFATFPETLWHRPATPSLKLLIDSPYRLDNPLCILSLTSLAAGYRLLSRPADAAQILSDILYQLPEQMLRTSRRSVMYTQMSQSICTVLKELLRVLPKVPPSPYATLRTTTIQKNLADLIPVLLGTDTQTTGDATSLNLLESTAQYLVKLDPTNPKYLYILGDAQLRKYDLDPAAEGAADLIRWAEETFKASIEAEYEGGNLGAVFEQRWWKEMEVGEKAEAAVQASLVAAAGAKGGKGGGVGKETTKVAAKPGVKATGPAAKAPVGRPAPAPATRTPAPAKVKEPAKQSTAKAAPEMKAATVTAAKKVTPAPAAAAKSSTKPTTKSTDTKPTAKAGSPTQPTPDTKSKSPAKTNPTPTAQPQPTEAQKEPSASAQERKTIHKPLYQSRLGLARILSRRLPQPDTYIELGALLETHPSLSLPPISPTQTTPLLAAGSLYASYPFTPLLTATTPIPQDELYLHGEVTRCFMKEKCYDDERLIRSLVVEGRCMGLKTLQKYLDVLDKEGKYGVLMRVYAEVNRKGVDDPELVQFFKMKYWM
ncbi:hypothetical protein HDV00_001696 [Rhizophlyctis rosea]|nr:hypothetical protein HDV00_001696 [Rhizophlyctis rosea]